MFKEWLIDIGLSHFDDGCVCFVPYERETGTIVFGMNMISDKSPGKLVGVLHPEGQDAVEKWCEDNPDWATKYAYKEGSE
jgi:hypothetical protein